MASKGTPKKLYRKRTESTAISRCRLCNCVTDPGHSKSLFREQNRTILLNAEIVYGNELRQDNNLPHLVCAPCVRRLNNFIQLKSTVTETQRLLLEDTRAKRCVEISPSVAKPSAKVRATGTSRRRSIDFDISSGDQLLTENATSSTTSLALHVSYSIFYLCFVCGRIYFIFPYRIFSAIIMNMHSSDSCIYNVNNGFIHDLICM